MLIKCCWLLVAAVVLLLIDRVANVPAVECISNVGGVARHVAGHHHVDGDAERADADDASGPMKSDGEGYVK